MNERYVARLLEIPLTLGGMQPKTPCGHLVDGRKALWMITAGAVDRRLLRSVGGAVLRYCRSKSL